MKRFFSSLSFKIGSVLIIAEIIILATVSVIYADRFSDQIDERAEDRVKLPGKLVNTSLVRLVSLSDADALRLLIGEDVENVMLVNPERLEVTYSLSGEYRGASVEDIDQLQTRWFNTETPEEILLRTTEESDHYMVGVTPLHEPFSGEITSFLYIRTSLNEAEAEKRDLARLLILGSASTVLATFVVIFLSFRFMIFSRIAQALGVLKRLEEGELEARVDKANSHDEIGVLQRGVNSMADKREEAQRALTQLNQQLEERVAARTRDLEIAADVSKQVTTVLEVAQLLPQFVELTRRGFDLYHVSVFLHDAEKNSLQLVAATGSAGKKMKAEGRSFDILNAQGLVPQAARQREVVVANNVQTAESFAFNPHLPQTRSEAAFPMTIGTNLVGVLDLQSDQLDRFGDDDVRVLTTLAEQIAVAVRNAQLFAQAEAAREQAEQADQVKSQFLASVSHELRTPLNAIINFTMFVTREKMGPVTEKQMDVLNKVVGNGRHLLNLINDVLDMSKIESGSLELYVEDDISLNEELETVVSTAQSLLEDSSVELITDIQPDLPRLTGDRQRILQIMLNLVSNACKFTEAGRVTIAAHHENDEIILSVADTGPGIALEDQAAVFESFKQTETGLRHGKGTGLGMPISRSLAEAHGGRLWLASTPGEGATFYVALPVESEKLVALM